jgi:predicted acyltransferase
MTDISQQRRLVSLDAFRGATIAGMILVNNPGLWTDSYAQLKHSAWNGWTFTDMIFPFFLWIMGVAMTFSFSRRRESGATPGTLMAHVLRRALIIFALGIVVNGFPFGVGAPFSLSTLRIPGVLQRIAICYAAASALFLTGRVRTLIMVCVGLLGAYWAIVMLVPVPGYGPGVLSPVGSLCWFVDSSLLKGHTWIYAPAEGFDPEGIVSTLPALATTLFGVLTGCFLRSDRPRERKPLPLFAAGIAMFLAGMAADVWLPINKNMWTSSYALLMGGLALICFAPFYWAVDVKGRAGWTTPLRIFGMNAITLYVLSELLATLLEVITLSGPSGAPVSLHAWVYSALFAPVWAPANASLAYAIAFVAVMFAVGWGMWKEKWFIRV